MLIIMFGVVLGVVWDVGRAARSVLGGLVWGPVFTLSVISSLRWMCSSDKCFSWWGPYLTTSYLSTRTDVDLKLPPFLTPLYFGVAWGLCGCSVFQFVTASTSPPGLNQVSCSAFVNETPVEAEVGWYSQRQSYCMEYFTVKEDEHLWKGNKNSNF